MLNILSIAQLVYGVPSVFLMFIFIFILGCNPKSFSCSFYRLVQIDLLVNIICHLNSWIGIRLHQDDLGIYYLYLIESGIPGALATSRFFCTFFFHLQNITGFSLYLHRLLTAMYSKSETYWKKYYCFVPIGGCLYSLVVLSPWYIFSNFYLRMETENGVLRKIYNTKLATISYSINPIFAMFYFLMVLLTGIWTSKIVATNNNSKINEFMARKMTIVATVNGILMSGNLIFTVVLTIIILSPIKSYGHTYSNTVVTFTSDMYTLAMPYILLFFDGNVQRLMRLADPEKPIRSTRVYMVRN